MIAGYGTPSGPGGYQNWGAPPGPQGQQMAPPQWGSNYPPQQTGYGSYGHLVGQECKAWSHGPLRPIQRRGKLSLRNLRMLCSILLIDGILRVNRPNQTGYGSNWNWNVPQNGPTAQGGPPAAGAPGPQSNSYAGDMYSGGATGAAPAGPTPPAAPQKTANDYAGYGGYTGYQQDSSSYGGGRSYAGPESAQGSGGSASEIFDNGVASGK
ncbi:DAZ-associated protein 1 [Homalodisca vitripennis]|nr:DAZ-associated protein 1 [Homalodisca vitripennis]